jgi:hypothetical protein
MSSSNIRPQSSNTLKGSKIKSIIGHHLKIIKAVFLSIEELMIQCRIRAAQRLQMILLLINQPAKPENFNAIFEWLVLMLNSRREVRSMEV